MSSVMEGVDGISIANQVRLERANHAGSFLLVEGKGEERIFDRFCTEGICSIIVCVGKPNLLEAIQELGSSGFVGAIGLADRDYFEFTGYPKIQGDLVYTEENDLDVMIIASCALNKVVMEFGNEERIAQITKREERSVAELVFASAGVIGALRMVSEKSGWGLKFSGMNYKFKPKNSFEIDENATVAHVYGRSREDIGVSEEEVRRCFREELDKGTDAKGLCNGHDCVRVLGRGLRKAFGNSGEFNDENGARTLERILRLSFEWKHFQSTATYRAIREWEVERGFRVFPEKE